MSSQTNHGQPIILFSEECEHPASSGENQVSVLHVHLALGDLLLIADGSAGSEESAVAARLAVEYSYAQLAALPPDYPAESAIHAAFEYANAGFLDAAAQDSTLQGIRASLVMALLQQEGDIINAWIGHVGDSRAYLLRAGRLHPLTKDHTVVQEMLDRDMLSPFEALHHPEAKVVTRSVGMRLGMEIEIDQLPLAVGDSLLLCSGSLWRRIAEQEIQAAADSATPDSATRNLLALALSSGTPSDIGIELARIVLPPETRRPQQHSRSAFVVVMSIFVLAFAGVAALIWYVWSLM